MKFLVQEYGSAHEGRPMTRAQIRAMEKIRAPGGHRYGVYSYVATRTAEALARQGLVVLGRMHREGERLPWAIVAGSTQPEGFMSDEAIRADYAAWSAEIAARTAAAAERRRERVGKILDFARATRRPGESDADRAERLAKLERLLTGATEAELDACEARMAELGGRT